MTRHGFLTHLCFTLAILFSGQISAQVNGIDLNQPSSKELIRREFRGSPDLPDGLAFLNILSLVSALTNEAPDEATDLVASNLELAKPEAENLIPYLIASHNEFQSETYSIMMRVGCDEGVPKKVGDRAFDLLDAMDDARASAADSHFQQFMLKFDTHTASAIQEWVDRAKLQVTHVAIDHRKMAARVGATDIDERLSDLCIGLQRRLNTRGDTK